MKKLLLCVGVASALAACEEKKETKPAETKVTASSASAKAVKIDTAMLSVFQALPKSAESKDNPMSPERISLGKQLWFEARLSKNQDISCNTCHLLDKFGVDGKKVSEGHKKQLGERNAPTVYNAAIQFAQFWDGRAKDVEEQATKPILNPKEMAMPDEKAVVAVLKSIPEYETAFKGAFPNDKDPITLANVGKAIGAFERTLMTPSKFDKYLDGDKAALSDDELKGLKTFMDTGCQTCHMGPGLGGTQYQKLGLIKAWPGEVKDLGRFQETKQETDKLFFKVPLLRNIEKTGPYLHDGSQDSLETLIKQMAEYQLGKQVDDEQVKSIVTFLKTLTGEPAADVMKAPELPKSTAKTPKPDPK